jgi:anti-anti-sigma regulatory factor
MAVPKTFDFERIGNTLVVTPLENVGSLAGTGLQSEMEALLAQLQDGQVRSVLVDLQRLAYFGTNMLEAMHVIWRPIRAKGGRMFLCNVSDVGREILRVAHFDVLWPIFDSRAEALEGIES